MTRFRPWTWVLPRLAVLAALAVLGVLAALSPTAQAQAQTPAPVLVLDNPSCADIQGAEQWIELKINAPAAGASVHTDGTLTVDLTVDAAKQFFDFVSNIGVDAVIVKGGPDANAYVYSPAEGTSGDDLHAPINPNNNKPFGLSHISFCYDVDGSLAGKKFEDLDADGLPQEVGEPDLEGWTIYVDLDDNGVFDVGEPADLTDASGFWLITGLAPGDYVVREVLQAGWTCSFPDPCSHEVTLAAGENRAGLTFGNWTTASKSGAKFEDLNADGVRDQGEPGLAGWTIFVDLDGDGDLDGGEPFDVTDQAGNYQIVGIPPGTFNVREVQQAGWTCSLPDPCFYAETFTSRAALVGNDFGNFRQAGVSGTKFEDLDADGSAREQGEPGLQGWTIYVDLDNDGVLDAGEPSAVTDANGAWAISGLTPGDYAIREEPQQGLDCTFPDPCRHDITLVSGESRTGVDFGNARPPQVPAPEEPAEPAQPPAAAPAPAAPPAPPPPPPPPPEPPVVAGETVLAGFARLIGPSGCVGRPFLARVRGRSIARVVFFLDGRRIRTVRRPDRRGRWAVRIDPRRLGAGTHRVRARVTFVRGSGTRPRTFNLQFQRCPRGVLPQFTG